MLGNSVSPLGVNRGMWIFRGVIRGAWLIRGVNRGTWLVRGVNRDAWLVRGVRRGACFLTFREVRIGIFGTSLKRDFAKI